MKWLYCGFKSMSLASDFKNWLESAGVRTGKEIDEQYGIYRVFYQPIGKDQKEKCYAEIERRIKCDLV